MSGLRSENHSTTHGSLPDFSHTYTDKTQRNSHTLVLN